MVTEVKARIPQGHCSQCHKIWVLNTTQGVCPWCGKRSTCQRQRTSTLRSIKSSSRRRKTQAPSNGNGYDKLDGKWLTYYKVASQFSHKVKAQDREDLLHDIMIALADVERNNGHKPFTKAVMYRIASVTVANYWRAQHRLTNGIDCGSCSKAQRRKCKQDNLYRECPKAIKLESLSKPVTDSEGNITELGELIADDKALDIGAWLDIKTFIAGFPQRLIDIAQKIQSRQTLTNRERQYLWYWRQREQKQLVLS